MSIHARKPVIRLERFLAAYFAPNDPRSLGFKLAKTAVDGVLISIGIFLANQLTLWVVGAHGTKLLLGQIPWTVVMVAYWQRSFIRYLPFDLGIRVPLMGRIPITDPCSFVCIDGRLKLGRELSKVDFGPQIKVCLACETDRVALMQRVGAYRERITPVCESQKTVLS